MEESDDASPADEEKNEESKEQIDSAISPNETALQKKQRELIEKQRRDQLTKLDQKKQQSLAEEEKQQEDAANNAGDNTKKIDLSSKVDENVDLDDI